MEEHQRRSRDAEIYQKALDLFAQKGYDATPMSLIAKVLGMSKANLYHYCSSKEDLLYQIHMDDLQKRFIPILDEAEKIDDPKERLVFFLYNLTLMHTANRASRVLVEELRSLTKEHQMRIEEIWRRGYELLRTSIKELQMSGEARKGRESFMAFLCSGMVFWIMYWFDYSRKSTEKELAETIVQIFLNGLLYPVAGTSTAPLCEQSESSAEK